MPNVWQSEHGHDDVSGCIGIGCHLSRRVVMDADKAGRFEQVGCLDGCAHAALGRDVTTRCVERNGVNGARHVSGPDSEPGDSSATHHRGDRRIPSSASR